MAISMEMCLDPGHIYDCARWRPSSPAKKGAEPPPQFSAHFYSGQTAGCIKMPLGMEVSLSPRDFVSDGDPAHPKRGRTPNILPMSIAAKRLDASRILMHPAVSPQNRGIPAVTAVLPPSPLPCRALIKIPLGTEVGLSPGYFVLDRDPVAPQKGDGAPYFRPMSIVAKRLHG